MTKKTKKNTMSEYHVTRTFRNVRVKSCPLSQRRCVILFERDVFESLREAVSEIRDEFVVFLLGARSEAKARVTGVYVPQQTVSSADVEADEAFDPARFVGIAHSHHGMGAFHSATDERGVDNAPISIVMSKTEWCAKFAHRLPCGLWGVSRNVAITDGECESDLEVSSEASEVKVSELGDCPYWDGNPLPCGLRVKRSALIDEIRAKSKRKAELSYRYHYVPGLGWRNDD
jgi:hypothetical protein